MKAWNFLELKLMKKRMILKNDIKARKITEIHSKNSKVKVLIIPTNEELEIAIQSFQLLN